MKIFSAQSNRGLVLRCIGLTFLINLLLAPIMAIAVPNGTIADPDYNFYLSFIEMIVVEWTLPLVAGIFCGMFMRKQNGNLIAENKKFFLGGLAQRQIFIVSILAAIVGVGVFFCASDFLPYYITAVFTDYFPTKNLFIIYLLRQTFSCFTVFSVTLCLLFTFYCRSIKSHTAYQALASRP